MTILSLQQLEPLASTASESTGVPESLLLAQIQAESGGDTSAVSPTGAQGLMQLEPETADSLGVTNPFNPMQNVMGGAKYDEKLYNQFGNYDDALQAYNEGPSNFRAGYSLEDGAAGYAQGILTESQKLENEVGISSTGNGFSDNGSPGQPNGGIIGKNADLYHGEGAKTNKPSTSSGSCGLSVTCYEKQVMTFLGKESVDIILILVGFFLLVFGIIKLAGIKPSMPNTGGKSTVEEMAETAAEAA